MTLNIFQSRDTTPADVTLRIGIISVVLGFVAFTGVKCTQEVNTRDTMADALAKCGTPTFSSNGVVSPLPDRFAEVLHDCQQGVVAHFNLKKDETVGKALINSITTKP